MSMVATVGSGIACLAFLGWCPTMSFAGVTTGYLNDIDAINMTHSCNCDLSYYQPICAEDTLMFSPCFAGCKKNGTKEGDDKVFQNCSCIPGIKSAGVDGLCESRCPTIYFIAFMFGLAMITFCVHIKQNPVQQATLRCVPFQLRTFAVAIGWVPMRIFGSIPASPTIGAIVQHTCTLWQEKDGVKQVCLLYDNHKLATYLQITGMVGFSISFIGLVAAWRLYTPKTSTETTKPEVNVDMIDGGVVRH